MSYQVLARKWRPRAFPELVGQEHVVRALVNALDNDRLHHAYLFTGTRGVGKTTIARILAKSLNCERGVGSSPCGECAVCREIDEGRFVDLIEVDAASRTKVEDTRELLENVQYAPTHGRFKVYLIDEVHMLSRHSFNALLKTLEEPPPHIKFLLATTDPQRLPVTILSRCLQFNLKRLSRELIAAHLAGILEREGIEAEPEAVTHIARAADGSVRDGLSLLDQAISYGGGRLTDTDVRGMLGSIEQDYVHELLEGLVAGDGAALLASAQRVAERACEFSELLDELISALQRVALAQAVPEAVDDEHGDRARVLELAGRMGREDVQLYYQIALLGRRDLACAPDPRGGFEMILLRMLAFRPAGSEAAAPPAPPTQTAASAAPPARSEATGGVTAEASPSSVRPAASAPVPVPDEAEWGEVVEALGLYGMVRELAANCSLSERDNGRFRLLLDKAHAHLHSRTLEERLGEALRRHFGPETRLQIVVGDPEDATPARRRQQAEQDRYQAAVAAIEGDDEVRKLQETFNARVLPDSIQPVE